MTYSRYTPISTVSHYLPLTGLGYLPPKGLKDLGPLEALLSGPSKKELEEKKRKRKRKGGGVEPLLNPKITKPSSYTLGQEVSPQLDKVTK